MTTRTRDLPTTSAPNYEANALEVHEECASLGLVIDAKRVFEA